MTFIEEFVLLWNQRDNQNLNFYFEMHIMVEILLE